MNDPSSNPNPPPHWRRAIRPLIWWFILVLLMFLYRTHERLMEQTRLHLTINLEGKSVESESTLMMDGQPAANDQKLSLGSHRFEIKHPKADPYSTNVSVWYGGGDLGNVTLQRMRGVIALHIEPSAARVSISGEEFSTMLTNSSGVTSSIPTGMYRVEARWANNKQTDQFTISYGATKVVRFTPALADLAIESDPSGAAVYGSGNDVIGHTPFVVRELPEGTWHGELKLEGYLPVVLSIDVKANQTSLVRTNLTNWKHAEALSAARSFFDAGEYDRALDAVNSALRIKPNDPEAEKVKREATVFKYLRQAEALATKGDYAAARSEAEQALKVIPGHSAVQSFLTKLNLREEEKKRQDAESAEQRRQERLALPRKAFEAALQSHGFSADSALFDDLELKTSKSMTEAWPLIDSALRTGMPGSAISSKMLEWPDTFEVTVRQELSGGGLRQCVVVGVQMPKGETQILIKVMEYKLKRSVSFDGGLTIHEGYVALHPSKIGALTDKMKTQIEEGRRMIEERIRGVLGAEVIK